MLLLLIVVQKQCQKNRRIRKEIEMFMMEMAASVLEMRIINLRILERKNGEFLYTLKTKKPRPRMQARR
jgi:hypothetical protein